jgi:hypothetical protein
MDKYGSENKAHNLNYFLKHSGVRFDYLVIADADEIFDENFVDCNIRFFYSSKISRLAYVTPLNQTYSAGNLYSNVLRKVEDIRFVDYISHSYRTSMFGHLFSASCIISNEFLKSISYNFPTVVAEDIFTENIAVRDGWVGLMSPLTVCIQQFDINITANTKRGMRIFD